MLVLVDMLLETLVWLGRTVVMQGRIPAIYYNLGVQDTVVVG